MRGSRSLIKVDIEAARCKTLGKMKDPTENSQRQNRSTEDRFINTVAIRHKNYTRFFIYDTKDISPEYASTLGDPPLKRECLLLYGMQKQGTIDRVTFTKKALVREALDQYTRERGGWLVHGDCERDIFAGGGSTARNRCDYRKRANGKKQNKRTVRFEDETISNHADDGMSYCSSVGLPLSAFIGVCRDICLKLLSLCTECTTLMLPNDALIIRPEKSTTTLKSIGMEDTEYKFDACVSEENDGLQTNICNSLFEVTRDHLTQAMSIEERQLLIDTLGLAEMASIFGMNNENGQCQSLSNDFCERKMQNVLHLRNRLHYVFQKFFSVICQRHGPLVIVFNNFQFVDDASLDLVESLLFDRENTNLMIVAYIESSFLVRESQSSDEIIFSSQKNEEKLRTTLQHWKNNGKLFGLAVTEVDVENLCLFDESMNLISLLEQKDVSNDLIEHISGGMATVLVLFIEILHLKNLIKLDIQSNKWKWDVSETTTERPSSPTISEMIVSESLPKLSKRTRSLLLLASCIGCTSLNENILFYLCDKFGSKSRLNAGDRTKFRKLIDEAVSNGILVHSTSSASTQMYHWSHESIVKSLTAKIAAQDIAALRYEIGSTLEDFMTKENIFLLANLVSSSGKSLLGSLDSSRRVEWAEINLMACRKAVGMSAFSSAARYAEVGLEYLPSNIRWKDHRNLMLDLSTLLAEIACPLGKRRVMERWCKEITNRDELTIYDKLSAYMAIIDSMDASEDTQKAVRLCLDVLEKLGCFFRKDDLTKDSTSFLSYLEKFRTSKQDYPAFVDDLPRMEDREKIESIKILCRLCEIYINKAKKSFEMATLRAARWSLHYGLTAESPVIFAYYGLVCIMKQQFQVGAMNGEVALYLLSKTSNQRIKVKTQFIVWYLIMPWVRPVRDSSIPLLAGYKFGLQSGDMENAMACIFGKLVIDLVSGKPLKELECTCRVFVPQMEHVGAQKIAIMTRILWQTVLNLSKEESKSSKLLLGEAYDELNFFQNAPVTAHIMYYLNALKNYLMLFSGEYIEGAELALKRNNQFIVEVPGSALALVDFVSRGIPLFDRAKVTRKRKFIRAANDIRLMSNTWCEKGMCSILHLNLLLDAEQAALNQKTDQALELYKKALSLATESGVVQDIALIHQRFSALLKSSGMSDEARKHQKKAELLYQRWGKIHHPILEESLSKS